MRNALIIYAAVVVVVSWLAGIGIYSLTEEKAGLGELLHHIIAVVVFAMAYLGHKLSGATGNPFKGLGWGSTSWYFLMWILGLLAGGVVVVVSMGMGLVSFDPEMTDFIAMMLKQAEAGGTAVSSDGAEGLKIVGYGMAIGFPTFGVWIMGAFAALVSLSWLGWFGRRLLTHGAPLMIGVLMVVSFAREAPLGLMANPMMDGLSIPLRIVLFGLYGACVAPLTVWLFLKTRSAVIPALAQTSYTLSMATALPFLGDANTLFGPPSGIIVSVGVLGIGIGLWLLKDPGGRDMAVAAVAHDGTPLNPEQLAALDAGGQDVPNEPVEPSEPSVPVDDKPSDPNNQSL